MSFLDWGHQYVKINGCRLRGFPGSCRVVAKGVLDFATEMRLGSTQQMSQARTWLRTGRSQKSFGRSLGDHQGDGTTAAFSASAIASVIFCTISYILHQSVVIPATGHTPHSTQLLLSGSNISQYCSSRQAIKATTIRLSPPGVESMNSKRVVLSWFEKHSR